MKIALSFVLGVLTGLAFVRIPHYLDVYADHSLPPDRKGDKIRHWSGGVPVDGAWPPPTPDVSAITRGRTFP